jgi:hypothetical protein
LVYLYQAEYNFVRLEGNESDLLDILTDVSNMKLNVHEDISRVETNDSASLVVIQCKDLVSIEHNSSGNIVGKMPLQLVNINIINSKNGNITIAGNAKKLDIQNASIGKINLLDLLAESATIQSSGSGNIWVNVSSTLDVNISGHGNIYYRGNPKINRTGVGSGSIVKVVE